MTPIEATQWAQVVLTLITIGATTYAKVRQACVDAGWQEDDPRLVALSAEYDARIARAQAAAEGR